MNRYVFVKNLTWRRTRASRRRRISTDSEREKQIFWQKQQTERHPGTASSTY